MCFNENDIYTLLKISKIPIFIDYNNVEQNPFFTNFPIFIINSEETIKFFDLPIENNKLDDFLEKI